MEIKVWLDNKSDIESFSELKLGCDFYPGHAIAYLTPEELSKIEKIGLKYKIRISNLNAHYKGFWDNKALYHSYQEIIDLMDSLATNFPDICLKKVYGSSIGGREMSALKISDSVQNDQNEAEVAFNGSIHGDEISGAENCIRFARHLCISYGSDPEITDLVNNREIWIFCMANPDGTVSMSRYNANNVDLNRDWGYMWDGWGYSSGAYSQPESKILRNFLFENQFVSQISFHNGVEYVLYPWYYRADQCPDQNNVSYLSQLYADSSGYANLQTIQGYQFGPTNGSSVETDYGVMGTYGIAMEISINKQPPASMLMHFYNINVPAMLEMIEYSGYGVQGIVTDSISGEAIQARVYVNDLFPVYTDSIIGDYHKFLVAGNYSVRFEANGYESKTINDVVISDQSVSTLNVVLNPKDTSFQYANKVIACQIPGNNFADEGNTRAVIGEADSIYYSLGKTGWIIVDMQKLILNNPGNDIIIYEGSNTQESYSVYAGLSIDGPWIFMANGTGTTEFELSTTGLSQARYYKIKDDGDGPVFADDAGFDLDAVSSLSEVSGVFITLFDHNINDPSGNNNSWIDPGETIELEVEIGNTGGEQAINTTGTLQTTSQYVNISQNTQYFGNLQPGQNGIGTYIFDVNPDTPSGVVLHFSLEIETNNGSYATSFDLEFYAGKKPVLIVDLDGNYNSGPEMQSAIEALDIDVDYSSVFPEQLEIYEIIFLCLGIFDENHSLTGSEGSKLSAYLNQGGKLYMEGGDCWVYDPQTSVHEKFNITGIDDGYGDLDILTGLTGSFTENLVFSYTGDNAYIDRISPTNSSSFAIFNNNNPAYCTSVAFDQGTFKTIGSSYEFGGLADGQNTKIELMQSILEFFGGVLISIDEKTTKASNCRVFPNPFNKSLNFEIQNNSSSYIKIYIFDIFGRLVNHINHPSNNGLTSISWKLPLRNNPNQSGIYFYEIITDNNCYTGKIIYLNH